MMLSKATQAQNKLSCSLPYADTSLWCMCVSSCERVYNTRLTSEVQGGRIK